MSKYIVNTEEIKKAAEELRILKEKCDEYAAHTPPAPTSGYSYMQSEVENALISLQKGWVALSALMDASINFLDEDAITIDSFDQQSANAITSN